jgi:serine/threonine protein kinase
MLGAVVMRENDAVSTISMAALVDRLAEELGRRWRAGERPVVEDYLARYAELCDQPEAAVELIYEELCLRQEHGELGEATNVLQRFPQWRDQLQILVKCHNFLEGGLALPQFPSPGDSLGDFRLLVELGRGGQGRVFLATQPLLADRPVVLKLAPRSGREHLSLARLQHTHIVPLYSVQDDASRNVRVLCMPYFGGTTFDKLQELLRDQPLPMRTGKQLVEALRQTQAAAPIALPCEGPACQFLLRSSYLQAICWMGSCLADALQYTHERGLVHLDLKPSNVLWAADGQPMLLDLHLAQEPFSAETPLPAWMGGTPAYMAPEQRLAMIAVREGRSIDTAVDGRADIYALGLVLCEALCGELPKPGRFAPGWLRQRNSRVTMGLADIIGKCLAANPRQRYATAGALADDLRRHLADLPLRGVANRSVSERFDKWRRRRPYGTTFVGLAISAFVAGMLALAYVNHETYKARDALAEGREHLERREFGQARDNWRRGLAGVEGLPFCRELSQELRGELRLIERLEAAEELHQFVDRVRSMYGADGQPAADVRAVEAHCRTFWERRDLIARRLAFPSSSEHEQVQTDLLDLAILWTDLRIRLAAKNDADMAHQDALTVLDQAEELYGPSCVLDVERRTHAEYLGIADRKSHGAFKPRTAWEHYAVGRALFRAGDLEAADHEFDQALALEPQAIWPNSYKGACAYRRARYEDAVSSFTACVALSPKSAWCYHNRGLCYHALGQSDRAESDFKRAVELDPMLAPTLLSHTNQ